MTHRLSNADLQALRADYEAGNVSQEALAERYGVSRAHVSRLVRGERRPETPVEPGETLLAVDAFLKRRELPEDKRLLASALRVLALKLDQVASSPTAASARATPALARQFQETLNALEESSSVDMGAIMRSLSWLRPETS